MATNGFFMLILLLLCALPLYAQSGSTVSRTAEREVLVLGDADTTEFAPLLDASEPARFIPVGGSFHGYGRILIASSIPVVAKDVKPELTGGPALPTEFALNQNFPNPFNPATAIRYQLPANSYVSLKVYDILGREVAVLVEGMQDAGFKTQTWNASNFPSGIYFYKLQAGNFEEAKKLLLMK